MVKEFVKGMKYKTGNGVGVFVKYDEDGDPLFKIISKNSFYLTREGLAPFRKEYAQYFKELPDDEV